MKRLQAVGYLITPSLSSFIVVFFLSLAIIGVSAVSFALHNGVIFTYIFGSGSSVASIEQSKSAFDVFKTALFANPILNKLLFFIFWLAVGIAVYIFVAVFRNSTGGLLNFWHQLHYVNARPQTLKKQLGLRLLLHGIALILWFLFGFFFFTTLLPFSIFYSRMGVNQLSHWSGFGYMMIAFVNLVLSFHLYVILLRFTVLRLRLFDK